MKRTVSYDKLWKKLIDRKWSRTNLKEKSGISTVSLAKLGKNENLTTAVLVKICNALDCDISEIMEITPEEAEMKKENMDVHEQPCYQETGIQSII